MSKIKLKTISKVARARRIAAKLPEDQAKPILEVCTAHAAMAETNSRLWKDNVALRKQIEKQEKPS